MRRRRKVGIGSRPRFVGKIKYIVGVDPSFRNTGICIHDNTGKLIDFTNITTTAGKNDQWCIDYINEKFWEFVNKYATEEVCNEGAIVFFFEDFYYQSGGRGGAGKLGGRLQLFGVMTWLIRLAGLRAWAVAPTTLSSFLLGKFSGKSDAKKKATMEWLHLNRNFYTNNDNIADAYVCCEFGYAYLVEEQKLTVRALHVQ